MTNMTITNNTLESCALGDNVYQDEILSLAADTVLEDNTVLARDSVSGKAVPFVPGGAAEAITNAAPFNFAPGDTLAIDVNNVGGATVTFDATAATITDTTTYPVADQDGLTSIITLAGGPWAGIAQTVTFSGATTTAAGVAAQMNAQLKGCSVAVVGGQVVITHDGHGTDMNIAAAAGTGALTWGTPVAGTGDVADIDAVTASEVETLVEADSTATATVNADGTVTIRATEELDITGGTALTALGLSIETITANGNGVPKMILHRGFTGVAGDNTCRPIVSGKVLREKLNIADGSTLTDADADQLRNYSIVAIASQELSVLDNQ